jgi:N-acylneuraminate cytidylyltransferase
MILAIIPARGGSKRLPGKNIAPFGGHPLIAWSIALGRALPDVRTLVSTDDAEIAAVATRYGADIRHRPAALAGDETPSLDVMIDAAEAERAAGRSFDAVMLLQPTNPLRPLASVRAAIGRFRREPCDSLVAVSRRPLKLGRVEQGRYAPSYAFGTPSRDMPPVWFENGWLYIVRADVLLDRRSLTGTDVLAFETQRPYDDVDIDEAVDLVVGEAVLAAVRGDLGYEPR